MEIDPIPGFDGYFVNIYGEVFSNRRSGMRKRKLRLMKDGYISVSISHIQPMVHRLVALTYLPNPKKLREVNHKDHNKQNNFVGNLEWCDRNRNMAHSALGGRRSKKKLTENDVKAIRASCEKLRIIAARYGVSMATVQQIREWRSFKWITDSNRNTRRHKVKKSAGA